MVVLNLSSTYSECFRIYLPPYWLISVFTELKRDDLSKCILKSNFLCLSALHKFIFIIMIILLMRFVDFLHYTSTRSVILERENQASINNNIIVPVQDFQKSGPLISPEKLFILTHIFLFILIIFYFNSYVIHAI
jgi:hypothetical protein